MMKLRKEHPEWPERWISGTVASELEKQETSAIAENKDFAFETNFSSPLVLKMITDFRKVGFKISLCYFGLRSEEESISRVILRTQNGGHNVEDDVIRFNFQEGLKNVRMNLGLFDNLTFVDGNSDYGHIVALHIAKGGIHEVEDNPPLWFKEQFEIPFANLK